MRWRTYRAAVSMDLILVHLARQLDIGPLANLLLLPTIARFPDRVAFLWEASFPQDNVMRQIYPSYRKGRRIWSAHSACSS